MTKLDGIKLSPYADGQESLKAQCARRLGVRADDIQRINILKRSIDARRKDSVSIIYSVECILKGEHPNNIKKKRVAPLKAVPAVRPVIVGSGPAGMLCALTLAKAGACPILLERGEAVDKRTQTVERYFRGGELCCESNVQFGEGGAGTFSDGKLTTGIKDGRIGDVIDAFLEAGAPAEIAYMAKPHIGTDRLKIVVSNIRATVEQLGGQYIFGARLEDITVTNGAVSTVSYTKNGQQCTLPCTQLVLAIGHSARDTFEMLHSRGFAMEQKPFSVGARIEHPQPLIDKAQYGRFAGAPALGAADYKLAAKARDGRGVYTFCMCPGGHVVAAASEPETVVTNGMSLYARDGRNANSAVLVSVTPADFASEHPLAGVALQRSIERAAYAATGCSKAPAQLLGDLLSGRPSAALGSVTPTYRPGVVLCSLDCCLPEFVTNGIADGCTAFERRLHGFTQPDAVLTAPETRSSSPVRICRDDSLQSSIKGVYPCGEGAGYAGGIMSAAVDGIRCAEAVTEALREMMQ